LTLLKGKNLIVTETADVLIGCRQGVISSSDGTTFELTSEVLTIERKVLKQSSELGDSIEPFLSFKNRPFVMADCKHLST
jgi:hypothetical protein